MKTTACSGILNLTKLWLINLYHSCNFRGILLKMLGFHFKKISQAQSLGASWQGKISTCSIMLLSLVMSKPSSLLCKAKANRICSKLQIHKIENAKLNDGDDEIKGILQKIKKSRFMNEYTIYNQ